MINLIWFNYYLMYVYVKVLYVIYYYVVVYVLKY